jgi:Ca-activated chloride channel family protein
MERRQAIRNLLMAGAASFFPKAGGAQQEARDQDLVIRSDVRLVLLDVGVKDRDGALVEGLSQKNFEILENGVQQVISSFSNSDLPVTAGILVDESRSMEPKRIDVISAAELFIAESNPQDEMFVLNFNDTVRKGLPDNVPFSDDMAQLSAALSRGRAEGKTALNDAIVEGLKQLELGRRAKKGLILVTDGGDNASQYSRQKMMEMVERSIATIYAIGLFEPNDPDRDPDLLKRLGKVSGGEAFFPTEAKDVSGICRAIAKDIRTRYTVGYVPAARNGGAVRHISIKVSAPGHARLVARSRTIYRYDEPTDQARR